MPPFNRKPRKGIMLCYPFEERRILNEMRSHYKWSWPVAVQPKLDGERCRFYFEPAGGTWMGLSSTEEPISQSVPHIVKALNESRIPKSVELDGELYCHGLTFEEVHSICSRRRNLHEEHASISYHVFDLVSGAPQSERITMLRLVARRFPQELQLVETELYDGVEAVYEVLRERIGQDYEGIIVRDLNAPYERKRCSWIMKFKPKQEDTYEICGVKEEVDKNGTPKGTLGAFECVKDGEKFFVGSGFTTKERQTYWDEYLKNPKLFEGVSVRIEYQNITSGKVPRFGVYKGILVKGEEDETI